MLSGILFATLGFLIVIQSAHSLNDYARKLRAPLWRTHSMNSFERSAVLYLKPRNADFMNFLDSVLPEISTIVTAPPLEENDKFSQQSIFQFFLGTQRTVLGIDSDSPLSDPILQDPQTFIPAVGDFPPASSVTGKTFIPYTSEQVQLKGIYVPNDYTPASPSKPQGATYHLLALLLLDLGVILALFLLGALFIWLIDKSWNPVDSLTAAFPLGLGLFTWILFLICWAGAPFRMNVVALVYLVCLMVLLGLHAQRKWQSIPHPHLEWRSFRAWLKEIRPISWITIAGLAILASVAVIISIGRGYSLFDDMAIWSLKGYVIADKHTLMAAGQASGHGLAYPLNLSLSIAIFRLIDGDMLPGSKLVYIFLIAALFVGCYRFWRQHGVSTSLALAGVLLLLSVPVIYQYATFGFANLPFTAYLILGMMWCIQGFLGNQPRALIVGGLLLSLAGWTRPEGIVFALALAAVLTLVQMAQKRKLRGLVPWLASIVTIPGIWLIFSHTYVSENQAGTSLLATKASILAGHLNLSVFQTMFSFATQEIAKVEYWGYLVPGLFFLFLIFLIPAFRKVSSSIPYLALSFVVALLMPAFLFYIESFTETNFPLFLQVSFSRAYFPAAFLYTLIVILFTGTVVSHPVQEDNENHG